MECEFILKTKEGQAIALTEVEAKDLYETLKKFFEKNTIYPITYIPYTPWEITYYKSEQTTPSTVTVSYGSNHT